MYVFERTLRYTFWDQRHYWQLLKESSKSNKQFLIQLTQSENSQRYLHKSALFSGSSNTYFQFLRHYRGFTYRLFSLEKCIIMSIINVFGQITSCTFECIFPPQKKEWSTLYTVMNTSGLIEDRSSFTQNVLGLFRMARNHQ